MIAPDYVSITSGLDAAQVIALVLVGGVIVVGVGFGVWTSQSLGRFISGDPMDDKSSPEYRAWWAAQVFAINELLPLMARFRQLNDWLGEEVMSFNDYAVTGLAINNAS